MKTIRRGTALLVIGLALTGCQPGREEMLVGTWACENAWGPWRQTTIMDFRADRTGSLTMHTRGIDNGVRADVKYGFNTRWGVSGDRWLENDLSAVRVISATANGIPADELGNTTIKTHLEQYANLRQGEIIELASDHMVVGVGDSRTECARRT